jgi:hypothetical protein
MIDENFGGRRLSEEALRTNTPRVRRFIDSSASTETFTFSSSTSDVAVSAYALLTKKRPDQL